MFMTYITPEAGNLNLRKNTSIQPKQTISFRADNPYDCITNNTDVYTPKMDEEMLVTQAEESIRNQKRRLEEIKAESRDQKHRNIAKTVLTAALVFATMGVFSHSFLDGEEIVEDSVPLDISEEPEERITTE